METHFRKIEEINNRKTISHANTFYFGPFPLGLFLLTPPPPPHTHPCLRGCKLTGLGGTGCNEGIRQGGREWRSWDPRQMVGTAAATGPSPAGLGQLGGVVSL